MNTVPRWALLTALGLLSACASPNETPAEGDSGLAPNPACGRAVGVPRTSAILAANEAAAPHEPTFDAPPWSDPPTDHWGYAHEAFPAPVSVRWTGTTRTDGLVALHFDLDGDSWTIAVEESAPIPSVPEAGVEVELAIDAERLAMSRASDGALLLTWIRARQGWTILSARDEGGVHLALGDACTGWEESGFGCGRSFLVYDLEASAGSAAISVPSGATGTLEVDGARYTLTNRLVSQRGGGSHDMPECGDFTTPAFDADVVIDAL